MKAMGYIKNNRDNLLKLYLGNQNICGEDVSLVNNQFMCNLPETLIITAEYDYLRIQDEEYCKLLNDSGVKVVEVCYSGMDHAFMDKIGYYPQAEDCANIIADFCNEKKM